MKVLVEQSVNSQVGIPSGAARLDGLWGVGVCRCRESESPGPTEMIESDSA